MCPGRGEGGREKGGGIRDEDMVMDREYGYRIWIEDRGYGSLVWFGLVWFGLIWFDLI